MKRKVIIVDDHPLLREGLKSVIAKSKNYEVIAEAGNGNEALKLIKKFKPDIALVDISLPDINGIELIRKIKKRFSQVKIMVISVHSKIDYIVEAFKAGAFGYLVKEAAASSVIEGLDTISKGEYFLHSSVSKEVVKSLINTPSIKNTGDPAYNSLTPREQEILRLLAEGFSNKEIADMLCISPKTVENHRSNIMNKLGLHSITDLIRYAIKLGLIDVDLWKK
ncbi:MAG: DNA-binding response regulator [Deltaproteobacteria bacterium]|nr:MAG: DNA-binding response regulator [Deltaproteobacteria bacterium]